jgi:hypothetical protein
LCHIWFRQDKHVASQSTSPILGYLTPPSKSRTPLTRPTVAFRCFVQRVIQATAVSQAVLVLSLWYIERLRSRNVAAVASPGSEYRLCATGLMLANKYLDDNTYTSKTWSGMTGIPLSEMNVSRAGSVSRLSPNNSRLSTFPNLAQLMEIEFLSSLDHKVGISDEAYLGWLDYLGKMALSFAQPQLVQQYPIAPADYRFTFQSNNPHSDYTGASYYDRARSSSPHHVPRVQSNQVYGDSSVPESSERIVSDPMTGMENGDRRGDNTAMPRKRPALEFRHDQPMQIVRRMRSAQHAGRRASARQLLNGTQEASLMPVSACSDPWQDGSLEISASVPPPSLASYQLPVTSYATVPVLHTDETTDRHMPISHVSNEMGYLQLPYDYRLGFQPRVEVSRSLDHALTIFAELERYLLSGPHLLPTQGLSHSGRVPLLPKPAFPIRTSRSHRPGGKAPNSDARAVSTFGSSGLQADKLQQSVHLDRNQFVPGSVYDASLILARLRVCPSSIFSS